MEKQIEYKCNKCNFTLKVTGRSNPFKNKKSKCPDCGHKEFVKC
jgi:DNA-directed RNA polymerase subunit RPC12/RpoP